MGYQAYPEYKDSGVEWLGDVPRNWRVLRADFLCEPIKKQISEGKLSGLEVFHYSIPVVQELGTGRIENGDEIDSAKLLIEQPQLLISKLNPRKSTICLADKQQNITVASGEFIQISSKKINIKYAYYTWLSDKITKLLSSRVQSVTRSHQRVAPEDIYKLNWAWPSQAEQETIAQFLDHKTAQIDRLIEKKQELIEKLQEQRITLITHAMTKGLDSDAPLKDSGIKCLGQIPESWKILRLRYCTKFVTSGSRGWAEFFTENGSPFLRITNLDRNSINLLISDLQRVSPPDSTEGERTKTSAGDVLISITADLGSVAVIPKSLEKSYVSQHIALIRPEKEKILSKWLAYSVFSTPGKSQLLGAGYGGTKIQLSLGDIKELYTTLPPTLDLQEKIITKTEARLEQLNNIVATTTLAISSLQEYRTALITAAVTGQIDVRDWQPPTPDASAQDKDVA